MQQTWRTWALIMLATIAGLATGQAPAGEPVVIGQRETIASKILGEQRHVLVALPDAYDGHAPLPVLYVLDAREHFQAVAGVVAALGRDTDIPPMIVVGVESTDAREHDLVPYVSDWSPNGGGSGAFLAFFRDELVPYMHAHYAASDFAMVAGKSYGGLFALWAATQPDSPFKAYLAASPSVFLADDRIVDDLWQARDTVAQARFVFVTHANEDDIMRKPFTDVAGMLDHVITGKRAVGHKFYMDETHETVFLPSLLDGLALMFQDWQAPRYTLRLGPDAVVAHYQRIIERLGLDMEIPERVFSYLGNLARSDKHYALSADLYAEGVKRHPRSAQAEFFLARGLQKLGKASDAAEHMQRAADKAVALGLPDAADYQDSARQYREAAKG